MNCLYYESTPVGGRCKYFCRFFEREHGGPINPNCDTCGVFVVPKDPLSDAIARAEKAEAALTAAMDTIGVYMKMFPVGQDARVTTLEAENAKLRKRLAAAEEAMNVVGAHYMLPKPDCMCKWCDSYRRWQALAKADGQDQGKRGG